ncbi:hypothetical protein JYT44_03625 [Caldithrix abyssi]|nr:hypothetical protein [Caldithrix abyssi]
MADDLLQEIFIKIHFRIDTLKDNSNLERWIYQIARNAITDHYRSKKNYTRNFEKGFLIR